jgi:hypothetical protein
MAHSVGVRRPQERGPGDVPVRGDLTRPAAVVDGPEGDRSPSNDRSPRDDRASSGGASLLGRLRRRAFGIAPSELDFGRRGFHVGDPEEAAHLQAIAQSFADGYHAALLLGATAGLSAELRRRDARLVGFAFEGAAMALALGDRLAPWRWGRAAQWSALASGRGAEFIYLLHIGAGWADARLRRRPLLTRTPESDALRWLALDGYGFHQAFFEWRETSAGRPAPRAIPAAARPVFDQGVGRALWFGCCAEPRRIQATIAALDAERHGDLWSGVGLAAAYAGRRRGGAVSELLALAGLHRADLAQGVAFAAEARALQGAVDGAVVEACEAAWSAPVERVAALVRAARVTHCRGGSLADYLAWRGALRSDWSTRETRETRAACETGGAP